MSQLRISRPGQPTELIPLGPSHARRQGYGGSALGHFSRTVLAAPTVRSNADLERQRRRDKTQEPAEVAAQRNVERRRLSRAKERGA